MNAERLKNSELCSPSCGRIRVQFSLPERSMIRRNMVRNDSSPLPTSSSPNRFLCSLTPISSSTNEGGLSTKVHSMDSGSCAVSTSNNSAPSQGQFAVDGTSLRYKGRSARYRAHPVIPGIRQSRTATQIGVTSFQCEEAPVSSDDNSARVSENSGEGLWMSVSSGECHRTPLPLISNWKTKFTLHTPSTQCDTHLVDSENASSPSRTSSVKISGSSRTAQKKEYIRSDNFRSSFKRNGGSASSADPAVPSPQKNPDRRPFPLSVLPAKNSHDDAKSSKRENLKESCTLDSGVSRTQRLVKRLSLKKSLSLGVASGDKQRNNGAAHWIKSQLVVVPLGSPIAQEPGESLPIDVNLKLSVASDAPSGESDNHKVTLKQSSDPENRPQLNGEPTSDKTIAETNSNTVELSSSRPSEENAETECFSRSVECLQKSTTDGSTTGSACTALALRRRQSTPQTLKDVGTFSVDQSRGVPPEPDRSPDTDEQQNSCDLTASPVASSSTSRISNFFSKHSFKGRPLKRTKSVTKLERKRFQSEISEEPMSCSGSAITSPSVCSQRLRSSRSHESLLSGNSALSDPATAEDDDELDEDAEQKQRRHCDVFAALGGEQGGSASLLEMMASGDVSVEPVHSSLMDGQQFCIQVTHNDRRHLPRLYSCRTASERDRWIQSLRAIVQPNREKSLRVDRSLRVWLLEAKDVSQKKRYYCELYLDDKLYARTSSKAKQELCFWGEQFELENLPPLTTLQVRLYREPERKRRKEKVMFIGHVTVPMSTVAKRFYVEKWYPVVLDKSFSSKVAVPPSIRIKCRYQCVDILPLHCYTQFLNYISTRYRQLCAFLEPILGVKYKEHIAGALVAVMQRQSLVHHLLADLVLMDVNNVDDRRLAFRGNSLATKASECYMRMVGERYLSDTLGEPIRNLLSSCSDLEVDPLKVGGASALKRQRAALRVAAEKMWQAILRSYSSFPREMRACFNTIWQRLQKSDRADMCENVVSSCIFLRFFCPAILSPSLFRLVQEYPDDKGVRNLTLVAKTLQTLANFSQFSGKESYMEFLNDFITEQSNTMRLFLQKITLNVPQSGSQGSGHDWDGVIDLGRHLSLLHSLLSECLATTSSERTPSDTAAERQLLQTALDSVRQTPPTTVMSSQATPTDAVSLSVAASGESSGNNRNTGSASTAPRIATSSGRRDCPSVYSASSATNTAHLTASSSISSSSSCSSSSTAHLHQRRRSTQQAPLSISTATTLGSVDSRPRTLPRHLVSSHTALSQKKQLQRNGAADSRQLQHQLDVGGSQVSISQLSTVASSGYQSQGGTSPTDLAVTSMSPAPPSSRSTRRFQPSSEHVYSATLHSSRGSGGYRQGLSRPQLPASPSPLQQQQQLPLVAVARNMIAGDGSDTQFPLRTARHCRTQSKLLSMAGALSMEDMQKSTTTTSATTKSTRPTRSSSSSLSPPRERRLRVVPPSGGSGESGELQVEGGRQARLKNGRRASVEAVSARRLQVHSDSDSSEANSRARTRTRNRRSRHYEKTFEEYEEEIRLLQCQMEQLQSRLDAEIRPGHVCVTGKYPGIRHQQVPAEASSGNKDGGAAVTAPITNILNRLSIVEDELRREQNQLNCALTEKERVIHAQSLRIAELNAANCQLLACLQETVCSPGQTSHPPASNTAASTDTAAATAVVSDTSDYKSSSC